MLTYLPTNKLQVATVKNETGQDRKNANYLHKSNKCIYNIGKMLTVLKLLTLEKQRCNFDDDR